MGSQRAPRHRLLDMSDGVHAARVLGAGKSVNASPASQRQAAVSDALQSLAGMTERESQIDQFELASDGAQELSLSFLPVEESWNVVLGPLVLLDGVHYTISGTTLSLLTGNALTGDVVQVQYDYLSGLPSTPISTGSDYATSVLENSPLVYYRMNGTGATEQDVTAHNRDGALTGNYVRSRSGLLVNDTTDAATDFGASNQRTGGISTPGSVITCPYDAGLITADFSCEFWTNKGSSAATAFFVWDNRIRFEIGNTFKVMFWNGSSFVTAAESATSLLTGTDYTGSTKMLAAVFDSTANTVKFYKDGSQFGSTVTGVTANPPSSTNDLKFGYNDGSDGMCDVQEIAWYGTALTATDIANHWAAR